MLVTTHLARLLLLLFTLEQKNHYCNVKAKDPQLQKTSTCVVSSFPICPARKGMHASRRWKSTDLHDAPKIYIHVLTGLLAGRSSRPDICKIYNRTELNRQQVYCTREIIEREENYPVVIFLNSHGVTPFFFLFFLFTKTRPVSFHHIGLR